MSVLTLVRHGQASLFADNYDELSELGRKQARHLGEFWARRRIDFDEVYCGPRMRQEGPGPTLRCSPSSTSTI
jgi:broad specificity phosphatase PhoE